MERVIDRPRILFLWPPELPYDLTLHYHYTLFGETAAYFKDKLDVDIFDGGVLAHLKSDFIKKTLSKYDYMAIYTQVQNTHSAIQAAQTVKEITPDTKILGYGPSCMYVPQFFKRHPFDGYVWGGDPELAIESYINFAEGAAPKNSLVGVVDNNDGIKNKQKFLESELWAFPPLDMLPLESYDNIVRKKTIRRFGESQISVTASRGCPYNCDFCFASLMFGKKDRRRPVGQLVEFISKNKDKFNSIQMFSPNFTFNRSWVLSLCQELLAKNIRIKWRCTTRAQLLDQELVKIMARAGCESVGIGVETLSTSIQQNIHKIQDENMVTGAIKMLAKEGINAKGYIMIGLPGQTKKDIYETIRIIETAGGEVRPSSYSPYQDLSDESTLSDISAMNRFTYQTGSVQGMTPPEYLNIIFNRDYSRNED